MPWDKYCSIKILRTSFFLWSGQTKRNPVFRMMTVVSPIRPRACVSCNQSRESSGYEGWQLVCLHWWTLRSSFVYIHRKSNPPFNGCRPASSFLFTSLGLHVLVKYSTVSCRTTLDNPCLVLPRATAVTLATWLSNEAATTALRAGDLYLTRSGVLLSLQIQILGPCERYGNTNSLLLQKEA